MPGTHVAVALSHGAGNAKVTVLAVHVVGAGTRVVPQPDAEVLDLDRRLLRDLGNKRRSIIVVRPRVTLFSAERS